MNLLGIAQSISLSPNAGSCYIYSISNVYLDLQSDRCNYTFYQLFTCNVCCVTRYLCVFYLIPNSNSIVTPVRCVTSSRILTSPPREVPRWHSVGPPQPPQVVGCSPLSTLHSRPLSRDPFPRNRNNVVHVPHSDPARQQSH
jgi:hypothetical protein